MATIDDVAQLTTALPEVTEEDHRDSPRWSVAGKVFAWERPFRKVDIRRFENEEPPSGTILAVRAPQPPPYISFWRAPAARGART